MRPHLILSTLAAACGLSVLPVAAQKACQVAEPISEPCWARYNTPPTLDDPSATIPPVRGSRPTLWMYVDTTGAVRRALIETSAGAAADSAALVRARGFGFRPALHGGMPVAAWAQLPINPAAPATCADLGMGVPSHAGGVTFFDSVGLRPAERGTLYRYHATTFPVEVTLYPGGGRTPRGEVDAHFAYLRRTREFSGLDSIRVLRANDQPVQALGRFADVRFEGYVVHFEARYHGTWRTGYAAVFRTGDQLLKVETVLRAASLIPEVHDFARQMLTSRAYRMRGCPR